MPSCGPFANINICGAAATSVTPSEQVLTSDKVDGRIIRYGMHI
jgi:hypothetical protein